MNNWHYKTCDVEHKYNNFVQVLADTRKISFEEAEKLYFDLFKVMCFTQGL